MTLAEDEAKHCAVIDDWSGQAVVQTEDLFRAAFKSNFMRANVGGQFTFTSDKSHASLKVALDYFSTHYSYIGQQGALVLTQIAGAGGGTYTMALASLQSVKRASQSGLRWWIQYSFLIRGVVAT